MGTFEQLESDVRTLEARMDKVERSGASRHHDLTDAIHANTKLIQALAVTQSEHTSKIDQLSGKVDQHTAILDRHTGILDRHTAVLDQHTVKLDELADALKRQDGRLGLIESMLTTLVKRGN